MAKKRAADRQKSELAQLAETFNTPAIREQIAAAQAFVKEAGERFAAVEMTGIPLRRSAQIVGVGDLDDATVLDIRPKVLEILDAAELAHDREKWKARINEKARREATLPPRPQRLRTDEPPGKSDLPRWDRQTEARNKWLYEQCAKLTAYSMILFRLKKKPSAWQTITETNGIKRAASAYAKRKGLPPIPKRAAGRTKQK